MVQLNFYLPNFDIFVTFYITQHYPPSVCPFTTKVEGYVGSGGGGGGGGVGWYVSSGGAGGYVGSGGGGGSQQKLQMEAFNATIAAAESLPNQTVYLVNCKRIPLQGRSLWSSFFLLFSLIVPTKL